MVLIMIRNVTSKVRNEVEVEVEFEYIFEHSLCGLHGENEWTDDEVRSSQKSR